MTWDHKETAGLARQTCRYCDGEGLRGRRYDPQPCNCVLRNIFRLCYRRFRRCVTSERTLSKVCLTQYSGKDRNRRYERLVEDYIADFCLISKRFLDEFEYRVFKAHFLLGADWHLCCRQLKVDRGEFFHAVYRIDGDDVVADAGDLVADIETMVRWTVEKVCRPEGLAALAGVLSEPVDEQLARQAQVAAASALVGERLHRAKATGELRADVDVDVLVDVISGPVIQAAITNGGRAVGDDYVAALVSIILDGVRAPRRRGKR